MTLSRKQFGDMRSVATEFGGEDALTDFDSGRDSCHAGNVPHGHFPRQAECDPVALNRVGTIWHNLWMAKQKTKQRHFIREWRKFRGLTQEQLADRVGCDRSYVTKIETGKKRYDQPFLEKAAEALRCEPADLIMRDPTSPDPIWSIWDNIPKESRPQAAAVLQAFVAKKTGTQG